MKVRRLEKGKNVRWEIQRQAGRQRLGDHRAARHHGLRGRRGRLHRRWQRCCPTVWRSPSRDRSGWGRREERRTGIPRQTRKRSTDGYPGGVPTPRPERILAKGRRRGDGVKGSSPWSVPSPLRATARPSPSGELTTSLTDDDRRAMPRQRITSQQKTPTSSPATSRSG